MRRMDSPLTDLQDLEEKERRKVLAEAGLSHDEIEEVETMLSAMPTLWVTAQCVVEGADVSWGGPWQALGPVNFEVAGRDICACHGHTEG